MSKPLRIVVVVLFAAAILAVPTIMTQTKAIQHQTATSAPSLPHRTSGPTTRIDWERLDCNGIDGLSMYRASVPGGWLITSQSGQQQAGIQFTFVPDVVHAWRSNNAYPTATYQPSIYPQPRTSAVPPALNPSYSPQYLPQPPLTPQPFSNPQPSLTPQFPTQPQAVPMPKMRLWNPHSNRPTQRQQQTPSPNQQPNQFNYQPVTPIQPSQVHPSQNYAPVPNANYAQPVMPAIQQPSNAVPAEGGVYLAKPFANPQPGTFSPPPSRNASQPAANEPTAFPPNEGVYPPNPYQDADSVDAAPAPGLQIPATNVDAPRNPVSRKPAAKLHTLKQAIKKHAAEKKLPNRRAKTQAKPIKATGKKIDANSIQFTPPDDSLKPLAKSKANRSLSQSIVVGTNQPTDGLRPKSKKKPAKE